MYWTDWKKLDAMPDYDGPAAYQVRLVMGAHPAPIHRLLGTHQEGILVIGGTGNMAKRRRQSQSARESASGSSTMNLLYYWERFTGMSLVFPGFAYEYRFAKLETVFEANLIEAQLIKRYVRRFADRPPLNSVLPNRYGGWEEADGA